MLQIYVYDDTGASFELDLYKEEPLKLTLSAEEITDIPRVNSAFSKAFRIPATQTNSRVFQWWYEVNTVDFDITKRVRADIYSDGLFYKSGHIRIQNAYVNQETSQVDLEVVFFGETRDFASQVGETTLDKLALGYLNHELTIANVEGSWAGNLMNGDVVYAIANRGYDYDDAGVIEIGAEVADQQHHTRSFQVNHGAGQFDKLFQLTQFTPMVRAKALIDAIFAQTEYSYSSDSFFNDDLFEDLYTDGLPTASATITENPALFEALGTGQNLSVFGGTDFVKFPNEISDPTNSYFPGSGLFLPPIAGTYLLETDVNLKLGRSLGNLTPEYRVIVVQGGTILLDSGTLTAPSGIGAYRDTVSLSGNATLLQYNGNVNTGVSVQVIINDTNGNNSVEANNQAEDTPTRFENTNVVEDIVAIPTLMKFDVKCIDFFKAILTKFKLIMVPSAQNEFEFTIKPWKDYIASGDRLNWTDKLDTSNDIKLKPIFFEQSQLIDFTDMQDEDLINKPFQEEAGRTYGALQFDSGSDMLNDTRKIETLFAPTPVSVVPGFDATSEFVIPTFAKLGSEQSDHGHIQELPMRPKPRLLFYNGTRTVASNEDYYYTDGATKVHQDDDGTGIFPLFTQSSVYPPTAASLNLNWFRDERYDSVTNLGESVYERYWNQYIQELYSPLARVFTGYFNLDSNDLRILSFDDIIFIQNAYYRVLKVYDAPITDVNTVKVDLVKILETITFANGGDPTPGGGGIDDVVVTGGGGSPADPPADDTWAGNDNNYGDDDNTWGNPTGSFFYHTVQACTNPGDTYVAKHTSLIAIGDSVKMSGAIHVDICYEVIAHTVAPEDTTVLETFPDCFSCDQ